MSVCFHAEKFNVVSKDHGRMHKCICPFSTGDSLFGKFGPKSKSCQFKLKLGLSGIAEYAEFSGAAYFFGFKLETYFLGKFGPKNQNYQFKLKFGT